MGLDNFFAKNPKDIDECYGEGHSEYPGKEYPNELYFRGNIYYSDIQRLTGYTIFVEWLTPAELFAIGMLMVEQILLHPKEFKRNVDAKYDRAALKRISYDMLYYSNKGYGLVGRF